MPAIPQAWRPPRREWPGARFARTATRELWLVTAMLQATTPDWSRGRSNHSLCIHHCLEEGC
jgi:hypothetical protein